MANKFSRARETLPPRGAEPHAFIGCGDNTYGESRVALFGAPFDGTASYRPGARFACAAIRSESYAIETYSPYVDRDLLDTAVFDCGDLELPFGNPARALRMIEAHAARLFRDGKIPVMLGGEHLVTLGAVRAAAAAFPDLRIVHFDAHADLRDKYLGETLSHATVMRRCWEIVGDGRIYQFGIRSGDRSEFEFARRHVMQRRFDFAGLETAGYGEPGGAIADRAAAMAGGVHAEKARAMQGATLDVAPGATQSATQGATQSAMPAYLTIDLDVLDPSEMPGTGTPEAGGVRFMELLAAAGQAMRRFRVVGLDIVELSPPCDTSGASTALACKLLRELLLMLAFRNASPRDPMDNMGNI